MNELRKSRVLLSVFRGCEFVQAIPERSDYRVQPAAARRSVTVFVIDKMVRFFSLIFVQVPLHLPDEEGAIHERPSVLHHWHRVFF